MIFQYNEHKELRGKNLFKKYPHDAGWDICTPHELHIPARDSVVVETGLHICIPKGLKGIVQSRSGMAINNSIEASNAGVIDYGFTGECKIRLYNNATRDHYCAAGDRVAQIVFDTSLTVKGWDWVKLQCALLRRSIPQVIPEVPLANWPNTDRGIGGCGSTGL
jgi:deoxyuridine 5'-triphosphate nucleotidohydrolase